MKYAFLEFTLYPDNPVIVQGVESLYTYQNSGLTVVTIQGSNDTLTWSDIVSIPPSTTHIIEHSYKYLRSVGGVVSVNRGEGNNKNDGDSPGGGTSGDYIPSADKGQPNGIATLNSLGKIPSSQLPAINGGDGGTVGITVIDYDTTDPANYISQPLTLADFVSVEGSAIIDAVNHQFKPDVAKDLHITQPIPQDSQYVAIRLDKIPELGTLRLDYSQYTEYTLAAVFRQNTGQHIEFLLNDWLFESWGSNSHPNYDAASLINVLYLGDTNYLKESECVINLETGLAMANTSVTNFTEIGNKNLTFNFGTGLDAQLEQLGMTLEDFIDYALGMGLPQEELATYINQARQEKVLYKGNIVLKIPSTADEMYLVLTPKYKDYYVEDREPTTIDPTWTASVEMNAAYITEWIVPEDTADGTYLIINGDCSLLGHTCTTGDVVQVYDNATKGLLFKGAAV